MREDTLTLRKARIRAGVVPYKHNGMLEEPWMFGVCNDEARASGRTTTMIREIVALLNAPLSRIVMTELSFLVVTITENEARRLQRVLPASPYLHIHDWKMLCNRHFDKLRGIQLAKVFIDASVFEIPLMPHELTLLEELIALIENLTVKAPYVNWNLARPNKQALVEYWRNIGLEGYK